MKRRDRHSTKLNNGGLSLIELLIAMTIIVIVSSAFFSGFVIAAKTNSKAKLQHKATSLAQNILEGLKAEDMDEIMRQFGWPTYTKTGSEKSTRNFTILSGDTLDVTSDRTNAIGKTETVSNIGFLGKGDAGNTKTYFEDGVSYKSDLEYNVQSDGMYYLYLNNLMMENTAFDALITLDGSSYIEKTDEEGNITKPTSGQDYNTALLASVPMMDTFYDAVVSDVGTQDETAIGELQELVGDSFDVTKVTRTISITVSNTDYVLTDSGQKVTIKYSYKYEDQEYSSSGTIWTNTGEKEDKQLRNLFLFIPLSMKYEGKVVTWGGSGGGTVNLETPDDREYEFYIIKIQSSGYKTLLDQDQEESGLKLNVNITEKSPTSLIPSPNIGLTIRTNLGYSLADENTKITNNSYQAVYTLNSTPVVDIDSTFHLAKLAADESKERIMDVKIELFAHSDDRDVSGGPSAYAGEDEPLTTLTGSIRN